MFPITFIQCFNTSCKNLFSKTLIMPKCHIWYKSGRNQVFLFSKGKKTGWLVVGSTPKKLVLLSSCGRPFTISSHCQLHPVLNNKEKKKKKTRMKQEFFLRRRLYA